MGKKHDKKGKKKVVLSLAEFNDDAAGPLGVDPELAALPTAPKGADEWEAQGGRPEYNSRGYKERTSSAFKDRGYDDDFDDRDWSRRGPLEQPEKSSEFGTGAERDWGGMRRGPLEAEGGAGGAGGAAQERDWNDMRRGPVDSSFSTENPPKRDWGVRKAFEAEASARIIGDDDWGNARRQTVEAEPPQGKVSAEQDWSVRKPIEAEAVGGAQEVDWSAPRRGPVDSDTPQPETEKDWTVRKGPIDAEAPKPVQEANWSDVRRAPVEEEVSKHSEEDVDWGRQRRPIDATVAKVKKEEEGTHGAVRAIDFSEMRRGSKLQELTEEQALKTPPRSDTSTVPDKESWRRDSQITPAVSSSQEGLGQQKASTPDEGSTPKERDWGAARRAQPMKANPRYARQGTGHARDSKLDDQTARASANSATPEADSEDGDDWTTVRSAGRRRPVSRRSGGRGNSHQRSGPRQSGDNRTMRQTIVDGSKVANTSPVTPVTSAVSES